MAKIKVTCELKDYSEPSMPSIRVHNHWNDPDLITIEIAEKEYTVAGNDLKRAVDNCMNSGRL